MTFVKGWYTAKRCNSSKINKAIESELEGSNCQLLCLLCPKGKFSVDDADFCTESQSPETVLSTESVVVKASSRIGNSSDLDAATELVAEAATQLNSIEKANLTEKTLNQVRQLRQEIMDSIISTVISKVTLQLKSKI